VVAVPEFRHRLVEILVQAGYAVVEADSADKALKVAGSALPELILMAIVIPDLNGLEIAAKLRGHLESPPIILLGSIPPIGINDEPLASLVNGFLNIDASPDELLAVVRSQVSMSSQ
jgi:two-component system OmpR family response regulator